jgi:hypothetical protein
LGVIFSSISTLHFYSWTVTFFLKFQVVHAEIHETETAATTSDKNEEEEMEVVIGLSSNPPPPSTPVVEMMSHTMKNSDVHINAVTMLSTQIRALSNEIKVHAVLPALGQCKATIPKSVWFFFHYCARADSSADVVLTWLAYIFFVFSSCFSLSLLSRF